MAKKTAAKRKVWMKFYDLRLNEEDLSYLRFVLEGDCEFHQDCMKATPARGATPDEILEDYVIARDMYAQALKIIQMIDRVCPKLKKEG